MFVCGGLSGGGYVGVCECLCVRGMEVECGRLCECVCECLRVRGMEVECWRLCECV